MKILHLIFLLLFCVQVTTLAQNFELLNQISKNEVKALGFDQKVLDEFQNEVSKSIQQKEIAGAVTLIARKGKIVHFEAKGESQMETHIPMQKDAIFRLAIPLPLALLQLRQGGRAALQGVAVSVLLLTVLMGPVRGPMMLFPYGALALWLGWCWCRRISWWFSIGIGLLIGTGGLLVRVAVLSLLLGENLWVVITSAATCS